MTDHDENRKKFREALRFLQMSTMNLYLKQSLKKYRKCDYVLGNEEPHLSIEQQEDLADDTQAIIDKMMEK